MASGINLYALFNPRFRTGVSKLTLYVAIISFLIHLSLYFVDSYIYDISADKLLSGPINAIYTPFSFLLVYEAYLLLYYLPQSTSIYVAKQYEIITLILIRSVFKDIMHLNEENPAAMSNYYSELWYDLGTVAIVFGLIFIFYRISRPYTFQASNPPADILENQNLIKFIHAKKNLAVLLLIASFLLGSYSFIDWLLNASEQHSLQRAIDINSIFFDHFFTILIMSDVIILLLSLFYTDDYPLIIRNSSFVISTILLKLSFSAHGIMEQILIIVGVSFGVVMYAISNLFMKLKKTAAA